MSSREVNFMCIQSADAAAAAALCCYSAVVAAAAAALLLPAAVRLSCSGWQNLLLVH